MDLLLWRGDSLPARKERSTAALDLQEHLASSRYNSDLTYYVIVGGYIKLLGFVAYDQVKAESANNDS